VIANLQCFSTALLRNQLESSDCDDFNQVHLVVAGGYDELVVENREYFSELRALTSQLQLEDHVTFLRNVNATEKRLLMNRARCLLYTPDREHFGIVPVEAMYAKCPVIAVNSGGPCETVVDGQTGLLRDNTPQAFASAMELFIGVKGSVLKERLGEAGKKRVNDCFSFQVFTEKLNCIINSLISN